MLHQKKKSKPSTTTAIGSIRKNVTLEQIVHEQNYKPISYQEFREKADKIEWEDSLEDLLGMLTR